MSDQRIRFEWTVPNALTLFRLALVIPAGILAALELYLWALGLFVLACLTDLLDGWIARKYHMISKAGMMLDPLADKLMAVTLIVIICMKGILPMWVMWVIVVKELSMIVGGLILVHRGIAAPANIVGKLAAVLFNASIMLSLLYEYVAPFHEILMYVALSMLVIAFIQYAYLNGVKGILAPQKKR